MKLGWRKQILKAVNSHQDHLAQAEMLVKEQEPSEMHSYNTLFTYTYHVTLMYAVFVHRYQLLLLSTLDNDHDNNDTMLMIMFMLLMLMYNVDN